jgi:hypothetical protein
MNTASVSVEVRDATDSSALVTIACADGTSATALGSELHGPVCAFARTLPSVVAAKGARAGGGVEFLVTEPCYWTPALPFLYDLQLRTQDAQGTIRELDRSIGIRRLIAHGRDMRLNGERIVLRGACCGQLEPSQLAEARAAETAILTPYPDSNVFDAAANTGVFLMVDATEKSGDVMSIFLGLSWQPAAAVVLLTREQIAADRVRAARRMNLLVAQHIKADDRIVEADMAAAADVIAVELADGERPPAWMARIAKPVIAIRRGRVYADLYEARAACDRLQAELAPEFNLAGYFV